LNKIAKLNIPGQEARFGISRETPKTLVSTVEVRVCYWMVLSRDWRSFGILLILNIMYNHVDKQ